MFNFYAPEIANGVLLGRSYNFELVAVSYFVAATAGFAGFRLANYATRTAERQWLWAAVGGVVMGTGVWAMHFIGMLAFKLPIPIDYDALVTLVSALPAVMGCVVALTLISNAGERLAHSRRLAAGCIIGLSVGVMHYSGMAAIRMDALLLYDPTWFVLSVAIAVSLGICAVYADFGPDGGHRGGGRRGRIALPVQFLSAAVMGLAVSGMHYVAMEATICVASAAYVDVGVGASPTYWLAAVVSIVSLLIAGTAIVAARIDRYVTAAQEVVRVNRKRMIDAIESISDGFLLFDEDGHLVVSNKVIGGMYPNLVPYLVPGTPYETILRAWAGQRKHFPDSEDHETYVDKCLASFRAKTSPVRDGTDEDQLSDGRWTIVRLSPVDAGGLVGVWSDVTAIKEREALYELMALTDALTKLPNRVLFRQRLTDAIKHAKRTNQHVVVMFIDLDRFKLVNDIYGHAAGDRVLTVVASRLLNAVRETDTVARLGGDEFAVVMEHVSSIENIGLVAQKILDLMVETIEFEGEQCRVGASIGISIFPEHGEDAAGLLRLADEAMYAVKEAGRDGYRVADAARPEQSSGEA